MSFFPCDFYFCFMFNCETEKFLFKDPTKCYIPAQSVSVHPCVSQGRAPGSGTRVVSILYYFLLLILK